MKAKSKRWQDLFGSWLGFQHLKGELKLHQGRGGNAGVFAQAGFWQVEYQLCSQLPHPYGLGVGPHVL
ncbi:MAG: hypothetical protein AAFY71_03455 [Bacteroidota bacterium]